MSKNKKGAADSYVERIMVHVIKWISQPIKRSWSWVVSINDSRSKIQHIQRAKPSVTKRKLEESIDKNFDRAKKKAEKEMSVIKRYIKNRQSRTASGYL